MRRISHFLMSLESIVLVFLTAFAGIFLLGGSGVAWMPAWTGQGYFDTVAWTAVLLALVAAWWLLLAYFSPRVR